MKLSDLLRGGTAIVRGLAHLGAKPDEVKENPVATAVYPVGSLGQSLASLTDEEATLKATRNDVWAYVGINAVGMNISGAPLIVEELKSVNAEPTWIPTETHPLAQLLKAPNEMEDDSILLWRTGMTMMTGNAYWVTPEDHSMIYAVHPGLVKLILNKDGTRSHYEVGKGTAIVKMPVEQMVHIAMPNPTSMHFGQSAIEPVKRQILIHYYYTTLLKSFFKDGATVGGILSTELQSMTEPQVEQMRASWNKRHQGLDKAFRTVVLWGSAKYQAVGTPLSDLAVDLLSSLPREAILAAMGVPPVHAGIYEYANDALARSQDQFFQRNQIVPKQKLIAGAINRQLVPRFGDVKKLRVRFDLSQVLALQPDRVKQSIVHKNYVGTVLTPNDIRKELGKGPHPDPVADTLFIAEGRGQPFAPTEESKGGVTLGRATLEGETSLPPPTDVHADDPRSTLIQIHKSAVFYNENKMAKIIRKFFDGQLDRMLEKLKDFASEDRMLWTLVDRGLEQKGVEDDAALLFDIDAEDIFLHGMLKGFIEGAIKKTGEDALTSIGIDVAFDVRHPDVVVMIDSFHNRSQKINKTSYEAMKQIFKDAYEAGEGIPDVEKRLRQYYRDNAKMRATRTAKTEMNGMVNGGNQKAYMQAGYEKNEWQSAFLSTSREHHMAADGQIVDIGTPFEVGGELLIHPGDPGGSPGNTINCYCRINPIET